MAQHHRSQAGDQAEHDRQRGNHLAVRADRAERHFRRVDQARVAHLAGLHQPELLHIVQQGLQHFGADLYVAHQAQHVLLDVRQLLDAARQAVDLGVDAGDLGVDQGNDRVVGHEARVQLLPLLPKLLQLGLELDRLVQHQFGFLGQVNRAALVAHGVVAVL